MKKVFFILFVIGTLLLVSCNTSENENLVDSTKVSETSYSTTNSSYSSLESTENNIDSSNTINSSSTSESIDVYNDSKKWIPF